MRAPRGRGRLSRGMRGPGAARRGLTSEHVILGTAARAAPVWSSFILGKSPAGHADGMHGAAHGRAKAAGGSTPNRMQGVLTGAAVGARRGTAGPSAQGGQRAPCSLASVCAVGHRSARGDGGGPSAPPRPTGEPEQMRMAVFALRPISQRCAQKMSAIADRYAKGKARYKASHAEEQGARVSRERRNFAVVGRARHFRPASHPATTAGAVLQAREQSAISLSKSKRDAQSAKRRRCVAAPPAVGRHEAALLHHRCVPLLRPARLQGQPRGCRVCNRRRGRAAGARPPHRGACGRGGERTFVRSSVPPDALLPILLPPPAGLHGRGPLGRPPDDAAVVIVRPSRGGGGGGRCHRATAARRHRPCAGGGHRRRTAGRRFGGRRHQPAARGGPLVLHQPDRG